MTVHFNILEQDSLLEMNEKAKNMVSAIWNLFPIDMNML